MSDPALGRERSDASLFRALLPYLRKDWLLYTVAVLLAPATTAMVLVEPWLIQQAIDVHIVAGDADGLARIALYFLGAILGGFLLQVAHTLALSYAAMRTITRVRRAVYEHTLTRAQRFFDHQPTGKLLTRATNDVEALGETLTAGAITILLDVLQVLGVLAAMFWLDAELTAVLLLVGPPLALIVELLRRKLRTLYAEVRTSLSSLNAFLSERLDGLDIVQLYRDEERTLARFDERLDRYRSATVRTNVFDAALYATVDGLTAVTMALMLWYGSGGILDGTLTAGILAAFIDYVAKLFRPIQEFSQKVATLQRAGAALSKIFSLLDDDDAIDEGDTSLDGPSPRGHLVLSGLRFAYGDGPDVIKGLDLEIRPGEVVALCGRTGSGKSTIGRILTRAYEGYEGSVTLDGHELSRLHPHSVRRAIGAVRQDVQLFPGDVRFNLTLGKDIPDDALLEAARLVRADKVIERLGGLDGTIEQGGRNVSAGEAQLLSFARTMVADPPLVILDEATASVDSLTEAWVQEATATILARKTTLVIAHRLSTIVSADRICVLDAGEVVESGPHDALLAQGGRYAELFEQQFGDETAEAEPG